MIGSGRRRVRWPRKGSVTVFCNCGEVVTADKKDPKVFICRLCGEVTEVTKRSNRR